MKGLLLKDLINLKQQMKVYALIIGIWLVIGIMNNDASFFGGVMSIFALLVPMASIAYDEKVKWDRYALTMPVTKTDIVLSKYLLALCCSIIGALLSIIVGFFLSKDMINTLVSSIAFVSVGLLFSSIILPIIFKFGVEKGRLLLLVVVMVPTVLGLILSKLNITMPSDSVIMPLVNSLPVFTLIVGAISIAISKHIYDRKEF